MWLLHPQYFPFIPVACRVCQNMDQNLASCDNGPTFALQCDKINLTTNTTQGLGKRHVTQLTEKENGIFRTFSGQMLKHQSWFYYR